MIKSLSFFGLGKLGLPLATLFAANGIRTIGIDIDKALVSALASRATKFTEPGVDALLLSAGALFSCTTRPSAAVETQASIILVPTPSDPTNPEFSSSYVEKACEELGDALRSRAPWRYHLIIISSTLYPGTMNSKIVATLERATRRRAGTDFGLVYIPDFVALGDVVRGFREPPFVIVGSDFADAFELAVDLYRRIVLPTTPIRTLKFYDAELLKLAYNAFLCMKISFGNFLAQFGDRRGGVGVDDITDALSLDPKIGHSCLRSGAPYGGACYPRDIDAFQRLAHSEGLDAPLVSATASINSAQFDLIEREVLEGTPKCVALLGLSFKSGTPVTAASMAFEFARRLERRSIRMVAHDPLPQARENTRVSFHNKVTCYDTLAQCTADADTFLVCNPDPAYANLSTLAPPQARIVDPWGYLRTPHPGLVRIGRRPLSREDQNKKH
jgi:UDPglucose 6-dehydrogenase